MPGKSLCKGKRVGNPNKCNKVRGCRLHLVKRELFAEKQKILRVNLQEKLKNVVRNR